MKDMIVAAWVVKTQRKPLETAGRLAKTAETQGPALSTQFSEGLAPWKRSVGPRGPQSGSRGPERPWAFIGRALGDRFGRHYKGGRP